MEGEGKKSPPKEGGLKKELFLKGGKEKVFAGGKCFLSLYRGEKGPRKKRGSTPSERRKKKRRQEWGIAPHPGKKKKELLIEKDRFPTNALWEGEKKAPAMGGKRRRFSRFAQKGKERRGDQ